jgi:CheY-like chemotaxis protein
VDFGGLHNTGPVILVVDDDDDLRAMLTEVLAWLGCRVWSSADGGEVLETPGVSQVRLALIDWHLQHQDGCVLADRLAERGVSVTIMSGDGSTLRGTRHPFLAKPFDLDRLQALLDAHGVYPMKREFVVRPEPSEEKKPCTAVCFS